MGVLRVQVFREGEPISRVVDGTQRSVIVVGLVPAEFRALPEQLMYIGSPIGTVLYQIRALIKIFRTLPRLVDQARDNLLLGLRVHSPNSKSLEVPSLPNTSGGKPPNTQQNEWNRPAQRPLRLGNAGAATPNRFRPRRHLERTW